MKHRITKIGLIIGVILLLGGCLGMPKSITPIENFSLQPYLGKWYEIARLDHSFEQGLTQVTAEYSLRNDGGVNVINRGYNSTTGKWQQAEGKAFFVNDTNQGYLKVSFFGPFYGSYVIFYLDPAGQYAFISGPDHDYLWLLSRTPIVDDSVKQQFITMSKQKGFGIDKLIFVEQENLAIH